MNSAPVNLDHATGFGQRSIGNCTVGCSANQEAFSRYFDEYVLSSLLNEPSTCLNSFVELVKRLRALTLALLPVEVNPHNINEPTGSIITPQVISAYIAAAGDFVDAVGGMFKLAFMLGAECLIFLVQASVLPYSCAGRVHVGCQPQPR